jgi:hypothetical protein
LGLIRHGVDSPFKLIGVVLPAFSHDIKSFLHTFYGPLPVTPKQISLSLGESPRIACFPGKPQLFIACLNGMLHDALLDLAQTLYHVKLPSCGILRGLED